MSGQSGRLGYVGLHHVFAVVLALCLGVSSAAAQATPTPGTVQHVICDSGCAGSGGGGASTIADGADVAEGTTTDVAVQGDTGGTISAKLRGLNKSIAAGLAVTGTFWQSVQPVSFTMPSLVAGTAVIGHVIADSGSTTVVTGNVTVVQGTGTNLHVVVDTAPTTAVTNSGLSNIPAQGQALAAGSLPVVLPATQITALTPPTSVTVTQGTGTNLHTVVDSAPTTAVTNASLANLDVALSTRLKPADTLAAVTTVGAVTSITNPVAVTGTFFQSVQPVSATALPLPTNAAAETGGNLATIAAVVDTPGTSAPTTGVVVAGVDLNGNTQQIRTTGAGVLMVESPGAALLALRPLCNALRKTTCR